MRCTRVARCTIVAAALLAALAAHSRPARAQGAFIPAIEGPSATLGPPAHDPPGGAPTHEATAGSSPQASATGRTRRTLGLALSGGAARGLAHIGFLKWLDQHRIPVDMVAGTSMGALVGAAFATGMSPDEIQKFVEAADWNTMLSIDSPFGTKSFRRRQDARAFPTDVELGLRHGISLPDGFSAGPQIDLMLDQIALPYYDLRSFDDLPTRFRCVAADIRRSELVVLGSGPLARALRASMALPGVFTPVRVGDQVLVDGGVLNNVPADITRSMGADVVVAVDVTRELVAKKRSETILTVVSDTVKALVGVGTRKALESADLIIVPDLTGIEIFDFSRALEAIKRGYDAAEKRKPALLPFAVSQQDYDEWIARRKARRRTELPVPAFLKVEGVGGGESAAIAERLRRHVGHPIEVAAMARDITALAGNDRYESISYRLTTGPRGAGLLITVKPKLYGPPFLLAALELQNNEALRLDATVRGRAIAYDPTTSGSEVRVDAEAGTRLQLGAELYQPFGGTGLFVAPRGDIRYSRQNIFQGESVRSEYGARSAGAGLDIGYNSGMHAEARLGFDVQRVVRRLDLGPRTIPDVNGSQQFASFRVTLDLQDDGVVPSRGLYARAEIRQYFKGARLEGAGAPGSFRERDRLQSANADASIFIPTSARGRLFLRGAGGSSFGSRTIVNAFTLGGPFRIGSMNTDELRGSNFLLANLGYLHQIVRLAEGTLGAMYAGAWVDYGSAFEKFGTAAFGTCFNAGLIVRSPLGPVFVAAGVDTTGRGRFSLGVGTLLHR